MDDVCVRTHVSHAPLNHDPNWNNASRHRHGWWCQQWPSQSSQLGPCRCAKAFFFVFGSIFHEHAPRTHVFLFDDERDEATSYHRLSACRLLANDVDWWLYGFFCRLDAEITTMWLSCLYERFWRGEEWWMHDLNAKNLVLFAIDLIASCPFWLPILLDCSLRVLLDLIRTRTHQLCVLRCITVSFLSGR